MALTFEKISTAKDSKANRPFFPQKEKPKSLFFQPKLTIGSTNDVYELGTDAMAEKVMHMADYEPAQGFNIIQRQPVGGGMSQPAIIPVITNREIVFPCPEAINSLVPEFIRESREHAVMILNGQQVMSPTQAQIASEAFRYLGKWRQRFPAVDARNPTESELSIASAEHYSYARFLIASGEKSTSEVRAMIDLYTLAKDLLDFFGMEWILALGTDGGMPTRATRCQNDWGHQGVNDGMADWATDHP